MNAEEIRTKAEALEKQAKAWKKKIKNYKKEIEKFHNDNVKLLADIVMRGKILPQAIRQMGSTVEFIKEEETNTIQQIQAAGTRLQAQLAAYLKRIAIQKKNMVNLANDLVQLQESLYRQFEKDTGIVLGANELKNKDKIRRFDCIKIDNITKLIDKVIKDLDKHIKACKGIKSKYKKSKKWWEEEEEEEIEVAYKHEEQIGKTEEYIKDLPDKFKDDTDLGKMIKNKEEERQELAYLYKQISDILQKTKSIGL